ncbi:MAG: hypothetical protein QMC17_07755, partial [Paracoccaceae bacterium]
LPRHVHFGAAEGVCESAAVAVGDTFYLLGGEGSGEPSTGTDCVFSDKNAVFIIGHDEKTHLIISYPMTVGHNFTKILSAVQVNTWFGALEIKLPYLHFAKAPK